MVSVFKAGNLVALAVPKEIEMLLEMDSWDFFCCLKRKIFQNRKNLDIGFDDFMLYGYGMDCYCRCWSEEVNTENSPQVAAVISLLCL